MIDSQRLRLALIFERLCQLEGISPFDDNRKNDGHLNLEINAMCKAAGITRMQAQKESGFNRYRNSHRVAMHTLLIEYRQIKQRGPA